MLRAYVYPKLITKTNITSSCLNSLYLKVYILNDPIEINCMDFKILSTCREEVRVVGGKKEELLQQRRSSQDKVLLARRWRRRTTEQRRPNTYPMILRQGKRKWERSFDRRKRVETLTRRKMMMMNDDGLPINTSKWTWWRACTC